MRAGMPGSAPLTAPRGARFLRRHPARAPGLSHAPGLTRPSQRLPLRPQGAGSGPLCPRGLQTDRAPQATARSFSAPPRPPAVHCAAMAYAHRRPARRGRGRARGQQRSRIRARRGPTSWTCPGGRDGRRARGHLDAMTPSPPTRPGSRNSAGTTGLDGSTTRDSAQALMASIVDTTSSPDRDGVLVLPLG